MLRLDRHEGWAFTHTSDRVQGLAMTALRATLAGVDR